MAMVRIFRLTCLRWKQPLAAVGKGMAGGVRVTRKDTALRRQASAVARWLRRSLLKMTIPMVAAVLR